MIIVAPSAAAQGGDPRPDELWTFTSDGGADINDVAIDADGKVVTAVQADGSAVRDDDDEVYAWDLSRSKTSANPGMRDDPSSGIGGPEGLGVVAIEPNPDGKGDYIAVGNEGSSDSDANTIYVYRRTTGGGSETQVTYPADRSPPQGAVLDLTFLDRSTLLAYHEGALSLLELQTGTEFQEAEDGRWDPTEDTPGSEEETIRAISVSRTQDRVAVLTSSGPDQTRDDTLNLHVLSVDDGSIDVITEPWTREDVDPAGTVELSANGQFVLVATGSNTLYYTQLVDYEPAEDEENPPEFGFSELPWSRNGPDDVTAIAITPKGDRLAAAFANAQLVLYDRTDITDEGPRAERVHDSPVTTSTSAQRLTFADGNRSLLAHSSGLMAFHAHQFQESDSIQPMWTLPGVGGFAVSEDGHRIVTAGSQDGDGVVRTYEQAYEANLTVETPENVQPGRSFNVSATIENRGSTLDAYRLSVDLPGSWNVENPDQALELLPGETGNTTITITPPRSQSPGEVTFSVRAVSQTSPAGGEVASQETTVDVQELHAAELTVDTSERSIERGATVTLEPEIANAGNVPEPITLRVRQDASWSVRIDGEGSSQASVELEPGESQQMTVEIDAPSEAERGTRNTFDLIAHPEDGGTRSSATVPFVVDPSYGAAFEVPSEPVEVQAGEAVNTDVTLLNDGNTQDTFTLQVDSEATNPEQLWSAELSTQSVTLDGDGEETVTVSVDVPRGAERGQGATVTLTATSASTGEQVGESSYELTIPEETDDSPLGLLAGLAALGAAALAKRRGQR